jgi:hypothetical protein
MANKGVVSEAFARNPDKLTALCELAVNIGVKGEFALCFPGSLQASCHLRLLQLQVFRMQQKPRRTASRPDEERWSGPVVHR